MPAQLVKGSTPKNSPSSCTCGHHYGRKEEEEDNGGNNASAASANSMLMAQSTTGAATIATSGSAIAGSNGLHRPPTTYTSNRSLDASFVQVPQHDYSSDPTLQQLHQEEQQKHGATTSSTLSSTHGDLGKAEYYHRLIRLEQAAHAGSSEELPPPLCLSCIQRSVFCFQTHACIYRD